MRWTASALQRHCGYVNILSKNRKRTPSQKKAMDLGTLFHSAAELWAKGGARTIPDINVPEVKEWLRGLAGQWTPPKNANWEMPVGLSVEGRYAPVDEVEPHVYRAAHGRPLLTAGRLDVGWPEQSMVSVLDFKTGRSTVDPPDNNLQLSALGFAYADLMRAKQMKLGLYYAREAIFVWSDPIDLGSSEAADLWAAVEASATLDEAPRVGGHCASCWERKGCAAYQATQEQTDAA